MQGQDRLTDTTQKAEATNEPEAPRVYDRRALTYSNTFD
jgi:hypothetical protein